MQCCGDPFGLGSDVRWDGVEADGEFLETFIGRELAATIAFAEERHAGTDAELVSLSGTVVAVSAVFGRFTPMPSNSRMLVPVEGSGILRDRDRVTGWEDEDDSEQFIGYLVDLEPAVED